MKTYLLVATLFILVVYPQVASAQDETTMTGQLERRLAELERDYAEGERQLAELDERRSQLEQTMLRISGAIEVLREMLETQSQE